MINAQKNQNQLILDARHHDAFAYLGLHQQGAEYVFRAFLPYAKKVSLKIGAKWVICERVDDAGLYEWRGKLSTKTAPKTPCLINIEANGHATEVLDTYSFNPILTDDELHLFAEGQLNHAYNTLGAHECTLQGVTGVRFAVWAPTFNQVFLASGKKVRKTNCFLSLLCNPKKLKGS